MRVPLDDDGRGCGRDWWSKTHTHTYGVGVGYTPWDGPRPPQAGGVRDRPRALKSIGVPTGDADDDDDDDDRDDDDAVAVATAAMRARIFIGSYARVIARG